VLAVQLQVLNKSRQICVTRQRCTVADDAEVTARARQGYVEAAQLG
jgi:hypothetical protein